MTESVDLPPLATAPTFVIEGLSKWTEEQYFPAAIGLLQAGYIKHLYITDDSRTYADNPTERLRAEARKAKLQGVVDHLDLVPRVDFIDKATDEEAYRLLEAEVVFIVTPPNTHVRIASAWLASQKTQLVFIEKPLCESIDDPGLLVLRDLGRTDTVDRYLLNVDHYLLRAFALVRLCNDRELMDSLGAPNRLKLRMIEAGGIDDLMRPGLRGGLIIDMMCHLMALVHIFGELKSIKLYDIGVARCHDAPPEYRRETFAAATFSFQFHGMVSEVDAEAVIGKGVVPDPDDPRPGKYIELHGENGTLIAELEGDFRISAEFRGQRRSLDELPKNAAVYEKLLREATRGPAVERPALLSLESASRILSMLEVMQRPVDLETLPTYEVRASHSTVSALALRYDLRNLTPKPFVSAV